MQTISSGVRGTLWPALCLCLLHSTPARAATSQALYEFASPSVVVVLSTSSGNADQFAMGSGAIIAKGFVLTSFRAVSPDGRAPGDLISVCAKPATLTGSPDSDLAGGVTATLIAADPPRDLALLVVAPDALAGAPLPISPTLALAGDPYVAIGSATDTGLWALTSGSITGRVASADGTNGKNVYQLQASGNPGTAGVLLNAGGQLIGLASSSSAGGAVAVANDAVFTFLAGAMVANQESKAAAMSARRMSARRMSARGKPTGSARNMSGGDNYADCGIDPTCKALANMDAYDKGQPAPYSTETPPGVQALNKAGEAITNDRFLNNQYLRNFSDWMLGNNAAQPAPSPSTATVQGDPQPPPNMPTSQPPPDMPASQPPPDMPTSQPPPDMPASQSPLPTDSVPGDSPAPTYDPNAPSGLQNAPTYDPNAPSGLQNAPIPDPGSSMADSSGTGAAVDVTPQSNGFIERDSDLRDAVSDQGSSQPDQSSVDSSTTDSSQLDSSPSDTSSSDSSAAMDDTAPPALPDDTPTPSPDPPASDAIAADQSSSSSDTSAADSSGADFSVAVDSSPVSAPDNSSGGDSGGTVEEQAARRRSTRKMAAHGAKPAAPGSKMSARSSRMAARANWMAGHVARLAAAYQIVRPLFASAQPCSPAADGSCTTAAKLSARRTAAVRKMAAVWKTSGGARKMAAAKMAASRRMSARKMSGGAHRLAAIKLNSTTQVRPLAPGKLAAVAHQMAARRMSARKMSASGARKMSATADAAAAPGVAVAAAPPASAYASPEEAVFKGDFDAALAMAQAQGAMSALASGLQPFIEAGNLIKRNRFDAARFYFRKAESDPRLGRLAQYWRCKMYRLENRGQSASECFAAAGLTEGVQP